MIFTVNKWRMDPSLNTLTHSETGEVRRLGEYHFILLEMLVKNADTVLSRSFLITEVWKNRVVGANSLPTAIHALRAAIDDDGKQQEIIKTIPKKGYFFNKNYLLIEEPQEKNEPEQSDSVDSTNNIILENMGIIEASGDLPKSPEDTSERVTLTEGSGEPDVVESSQKSKIQKKWLITVAVLMTAFILFAFIFFLEKPMRPTAGADQPELVKEEVKNADRVTIYHLYYQGVNKNQHNDLDHHLTSAIPLINDLLVHQQAAMTMYYKISLSKISMNLLFVNQCQHSQQLMLNIEHWQGKDNQLDQILYKETENILNAMPKC